MFNSDIHTFDLSSLIDLTGDDAVPSYVPVDDYGYESDSDLEECNDDASATLPELLNDPPAVSSTSSFEDEDDK